MNPNGELRPTLIRTNARFRGPTESAKYLNTINETVHDIKLLKSILDKDEFIFDPKRGQTNYIKDNFSVLFSGEEKPIHANINSSGELFRILNPATENTDLSDTAAWSGSHQRKKIKEGVQLTGIGTENLSTTIDVVEGQVIYVQVKVKSEQALEAFTIKSDLLNQGIGSSVSFGISSGEETYVGHIIECKHKESIDISFQLDASAEEERVVILEGIAVNNILKENMHLSPINTSLKNQVKSIEEELKNIINNM